eukprot:GHRR01016650.1.p1 GENE.GHRR01016650.1~~GHRR01016650.1.p1  ORF type:complete len:148 (+),score=48.95 GHRR01016650.1:1087-1530(+)
MAECSKPNAICGGPDAATPPAYPLGSDNTSSSTGNKGFNGGGNGYGLALQLRGDGNHAGVGSRFKAALAGRQAAAATAAGPGVGRKAAWPCFSAGSDRVVAALEARFVPGLSEGACVQHVLRLISSSLDAWTTRQYDYYQRVLNGIL